MSVPHQALEGEWGIEMTETPDRWILPVEFAGVAEVIDGVLTVGGVDIPIGKPIRDLPVYVRRDSSDLSVMEVLMARHDGYAQEELDAQNDAAERYPLGPKEYWRKEMVGKYLYGPDEHLMTDEEFEADWPEDEEEPAPERPHLRLVDPLPKEAS
jgi:hypothetical protein